MSCGRPDGHDNRGRNTRKRRRSLYTSHRSRYGGLKTTGRFVHPNRTVSNKRERLFTTFRSPVTVVYFPPPHTHTHTHSRILLGFPGRNGVTYHVPGQPRTAVRRDHDGRAPFGIVRDVTAVVAAGHHNRVDGVDVPVARAVVAVRFPVAGGEHVNHTFPVPALRNRNAMLCLKTVTVVNRRKRGGHNRFAR